MNQKDQIRHFLLLQINDALFPIGGYSHSYGLETYIQKGLVTDEASAGAFLDSYIRKSLKYTGLLAVRLSWRAAAEGNLEKLSRLEEVMEASRVPREIREAAQKLGSRFVKTVSALELGCGTEIFERYRKEREGKTVSHCCAYGVFCASLQIPEEEAVSGFLYAQVSAMVTNCVKAIPLSQTAGQKLLSGCYPALCQIQKETAEMGEEWLCASAPGFDLRSMQHESLYSRLYMS